MMHGGYIGGQRAGVFRELVRGIDPGRMLLVGVNVAKATQYVVAAPRGGTDRAGWRSARLRGVARLLGQQEITLGDASSLPSRGALITL
jgi:hypothetical protein